MDDSELTRGLGAYAELGRGLGAGCLTAAIVVAVVLMARDRGRTDPLPGAGWAIAMATGWGIALQRLLPIGVVLGTIGVGVVCAVPRLGRSTVLLITATAPFAWILALESSSTPWIRAVVLLGASVGAVGAARTEEVWRNDAVTPTLLAMTAAGVFAAAPDTEESSILLGVTVALAVLGWPARLATLGRGGAGAATALTVWVVAVGGRGRPPSIVGGLACVGLLVALAAGQLVRSRSRPVARHLAPHPAPVLPVLAAHAAVVLVASRVAGISAEMRVAVPVAAMSFVAALVVGASLARPEQFSRTA